MEALFDEEQYRDWVGQCRTALSRIDGVKEFLEGLEAEGAIRASNLLGSVSALVELAKELVPTDENGNAVATPYRPDVGEDDTEADEAEAEAEPEAEAEAEAEVGDPVEDLNLETRLTLDDQPPPVAEAPEAPVIGEYIPHQNLRPANRVEGLRLLRFSSLTKDKINRARENGSLFKHPRYEEALETASQLAVSEENYTNQREPCPICLGNTTYKVKKHPSNPHSTALHGHIRQKHGDLFFLSREQCPELAEDRGFRLKCGCDGNGVPHFFADGYSNLYALREHLRQSLIHNPEDGERTRRRHNEAKAQHRRNSLA
jgi:hypothetical protein